jgi:hypothetical protein
LSIAPATLRHTRAGNSTRSATQATITREPRLTGSGA